MINECARSESLSMQISPSLSAIFKYGGVCILRASGAGLPPLTQYNTPQCDETLITWLDRDFPGGCSTVVSKPYCAFHHINKSLFSCSVLHFTIVVFFWRCISGRGSGTVARGWIIRLIWELVAAVSWCEIFKREWWIQSACAGKW